VVQTESLLKTAAPERMRGTILGVVSALTFVAAAAGFFPLGWMFDHFSAASVPTARAFVAMGALATTLAAAFWFVAGKLGAAPAAGDSPRADAVLSLLSDAVSRRGRDAVYADIDEIIRQVKWGRWRDDIHGAMADKNSLVLLAQGPDGKVIGFQIVTDHYHDEATGRTVLLPGACYGAYLATHPDNRVKGVGRALFLEASRRIRAAGFTERVSHIRKGSPHMDFFASMAKHGVSIKSQTEDVSYVSGEIWMYTVFDLSKLPQETL
jgi:GNAT superfamily N-acetyltransferase